MARKIGMRDVGRFGSRLVKLVLEYYKKSRCGECPVRAWCAEEG